MREKIVKSYYDFFDKDIGDSTLVVAIIGVMIFLAGFLGNGGVIDYKANILEYRKYSNESVVYIDGKKYKISLQEVK